MAVPHSKKDKLHNASEDETRGASRLSAAGHGDYHHQAIPCYSTLAQHISTGATKVYLYPHNMSTAPLRGLKVLDLSKVLAGPLCAQYLGDMGAEVVKVEATGGDETRQWPPFRIDADGGRTGTRSSLPTATSAALPWTCATKPGAPLCCAWLPGPTWPSTASAPGSGQAGRGRGHAARPQPAAGVLHYLGLRQRGIDAPRQGLRRDPEAFCGMPAITGEPDGPTGAQPLLGRLTRPRPACANRHPGAAELERERTSRWHCRGCSSQIPLPFFGYFLRPTSAAPSPCARVPATNRCAPTKSSTWLTSR